MLASKFAGYSPVIRSDRPLGDDQLREVCPSIFAPAPHASRSSHYTYIPTADVLAGLRREGFQPFFACQTRVRVEGKREFTKHMIRLRYEGAIARQGEANEIILLNSHDGTSSYQMLAGMFRFVCQNGLVCGDISSNIRVHHKGDVAGKVVDAAFEVLSQFERVEQQKEGMKALQLAGPEQELFAEAALTLRYGEETAPIQPQQVLLPRRFEDRDNSLWATFNRVQENMLRGGLPGRTATNRRTRTREVRGIDQDVKLNRGLWLLAERMQELKRAA